MVVKWTIEKKNIDGVDYLAGWQYDPNGEVEVQPPKDLLRADGKLRYIVNADGTYTAREMTQAETDALAAKQTLDAQQTQQIQQVTDYVLQGFQVLMTEIDYLRPSTKPPTTQWTAMLTKLQQLKDIVGG